MRTLGPRNGRERQAMYKDFYQWTQEQVSLLKAGDFDNVDWNHVIEEIEEMGIALRRQLASRLKVLFAHMLKWEYQPEKRTKSWDITIATQKDEIEELLEDAPSLRNYLPELVPRAYKRARRLASMETGLPLETFPDECPYKLGGDPNSTKTA